ncbi:hypothetical protein KKG46_06270, partial [Patescibacteria group bacterium]|nr:hypothetical protein [Patescibacteria group bacterium]
RWIMTGNSITNSYMEYFIPAGYGISSVNEKYYDYRFGLFKFSLQQSDVGTACKWNPGWAGLDFPAVTQSEGMDFSCESYLQQIQSSSQQFVSKFNTDFDGIVDRTSEQLYSTAEGRPIKLKCAIPGQDSCFYKYWDTGYNDENQDSFSWPETVNSNDTEKFNFREQYKSYYAKECRTSEPYFGIRAMFQNVDPKENALNPEEVSNSEFDGPWQFVGFWMTTCMPTSRPSNPAWLYMRMDEVIADVCHEVGQVIAPNTRESTAFADRVWSRGNFLLPVLGLEYTSRHEPSGSALATGKIGSEPMLMGASVPTSGANGKMPTFVDSGTGVAPYLNPQNNWVPLTNLFARVYKIWRWEPSTVSKYDWACVDGPLKGKLCDPWSNAYNGLRACGGYSTCNTDIDPDLKNQNWRCNTLSGVNRGLSCGKETYPARNTDPICHNAAVAYKENPENLNDPILTPLYDACVEGYKASFKIPLKDFGYCAEFITAGGRTWKFECKMDVDSSWGWDDDTAVLPFEVFKCTNIDRSFVVPMKGQVNDNAPAGSATVNYWPMWEVAANFMLVNISAATTDLDYTKHTANCNAEKIAGIFPDIVKTNTVFQGDIWDINANQVVGRIEDVANEFLAQKDYPLGFELGFWDNDRINPLRVNTCGSRAVNPGERCGVPSSESPDCPREIAVCGSQAHKDAVCGQGKPCPQVASGNADYYPDGTPACSKCVKTDPGDANNRKLYPGTGYCQGFNPLSRCEENSDCVFTDFEFWGAHDNGDATGSDWVDANGELIYYNNDTQFTFDPTPRVPDVRLPTLTGLNAEYFFPAVLTNFGSLYVLDNGKKISMDNGMFNPSTKCPNRAFQYLCEAMFSDDPNQIFSSSDDNIEDSYLTCLQWCKASAFLVPNSYAAGIEDTAYAEALNPGRYRAAAVAPFAVNPLPQNLKSMSVWSLVFPGGFPIPGQIADLYHAHWLKGILFRGAFGGKDVEPGDDPYQMGTAFPDTPIVSNIAASHFYNQVDPNEPGGELNQRIGQATDATNDRKYLNTPFPWDSSRLYFTSIFPLINDSYNNPVPLKNASWGFGNWESWMAFNDIWAGYGMSEKLIELFQGYIDSYNGTITDAKEQERARQKYYDQYMIDLKEEFFDKTGWGTFMKPDEPKLQLFPGAVPAAVPNPDMNSQYKDSFYVFIPGHCEPPQGGTDIDTISGNLMDIMSVASQGKLDADDIPLGPAVGRPFWSEDPTSYNNPVGVTAGINPWESWTEMHKNYNFDEPDENKTNFTTKGYGTSEVYRHNWTPSYVLQDFNIDAQSIPM